MGTRPFGSFENPIVIGESGDSPDDPIIIDDGRLVGWVRWTIYEPEFPELVLMIAFSPDVA